MKLTKEEQKQFSLRRREEHKNKIFMQNLAEMELKILTKDKK